MRLLLVVALLSLSASAAPKKKVVLLSSPPAIAKLLAKELGKKYRFIPLKKSLGDVPTPKDVRAATLPAKAVAVLLVQPGKKYITMQILNGSDGSTIDAVNLKTVPRKPVKKLPKAVVKSVDIALAAGAVPSRESGKAVAAEEPEAVKHDISEPVDREVTKESKVAAKVDDKKPVARDEFNEKIPEKKLEQKTQGPSEEVAEIARDKPSETRSEAPALPALRAGIGIKGVNRAFNWTGAGDTLATYSLPFALAIALDAQWFPAAHFTNSVAANIGVFVNADIAIGLASSQENPETQTKSLFPTRSDHFKFGGILRLPIANKHEVNLHGGYGTQTFSIAAVAANDGSPRPNIPSVTFNGARFGLGGRINFGMVGLDLGGAYQAVVGTGELASERYFPGTTAFALDATAGLSLEMVQHLNLRFGFDWKRYFLNLNPQDGQTFVANSAADQYLSGGVSVLWTM
jgi:hypothetical protein